MKFAKRLCDFVLSFILLGIFSPLIVVIIIVLLIANRGTPFFIQDRPGRNNQIFTLIKFKTMNDERDLNGKLLPDSDRLTKAGRFIRTTSLDELPQLFNVLKGNMSLIGPRPLLLRYLSRYTPEQARRHNVRPGITGWAQVNGRNTISWDKKFELDAHYVDNISFLLDCKIFWLTLVKVIGRKGINTSENTTISEFMGTK